MTRRELDRYYTPDRLARAAVAAVGRLAPITGEVYEPHVGGGAFARAILDLTTATLTVGDLDPAAPGLRVTRPGGGGGEALVGQVGADFLDLDHARRGFDWIIGNPPYLDAEAHIAQGLRLSRRVVYLLRLGILAGQGRAERLHSVAPLRHVWTLAGRPSFTADGRTDRYDYALCFWDRDYTGPAGLTAGWRWKEADHGLA